MQDNVLQDWGCGGPEQHGRGKVQYDTVTPARTIPRPGTTNDPRKRSNLQPHDHVNAVFCDFVSLLALNASATALATYDS